MRTMRMNLLALALLPALANAQTVERTTDGVIVRPADGKAADVRLQLVNDHIVRVSADLDGDFARSASLMRVPVSGSPTFKLVEGKDSVRLQADGIAAEVSLRDGQVRFFDKAGKPLVAEVDGAREFIATEFEGTPYYSVRQRFESQDGEGQYGTGLHQQGWMNLKGRDVELLQHNIDNAIPYLLSTRNYGILWDNNSITRYGDPRGLQPLGTTLDLFDADGKKGALTARYGIGGKQTVERRESAINYQYIKDLTAFPEAGKNLAQGGRSTVTWEGKVALPVSWR